MSRSHGRRCCRMHKRAQQQAAKTKRRGLPRRPRHHLAGKVLAGVLPHRQPPPHENCQVPCQQLPLPENNRGSRSSSSHKSSSDPSIISSSGSSRSSRSGSSSSSSSSSSNNNNNNNKNNNNSSSSSSFGLLLHLQPQLHRVLMRTVRAAHPGAGKKSLRSCRIAGAAPKMLRLRGGCNHRSGRRRPWARGRLPEAPPTAASLSSRWGSVTIAAETAAISNLASHSRRGRRKRMRSAVRLSEARPWRTAAH
mmetsp:Transcript_138826/g.442802  ORF Transcript_138826/g.442802 Transcript_138826/m.442802 type:complete len:251 (-) Transcript_138826:298-1050(-)